MKTKKLLPHKHTAKVVPHKHTSYLTLLLILLLATLPLLCIGQGIAQAAATDPVQGQTSTYAVVPGPPPGSAATITNVSSGTTYRDNTPIVLSGACSDDALLKIYDNEILAGSTLCAGGSYSVSIGLFTGINTIIIRSYNANNIAGPDSAPLTVKRVFSGASGNAHTNTNHTKQFTLTSEVEYRGINQGETLNLPLTIRGGRGPFAVNVAWGDGKTDLFSRPKSGSFTATHVYDKAGSGYHNSYNITVTGSDAANDKAFLQLASIVSGDGNGLVTAARAGYNWSRTMRFAWITLGVSLVVVISFWAGERREALVLRHVTGKT